MFVYMYWIRETSCVCVCMCAGLEKHHMCVCREMMFKKRHRGCVCVCVCLSVQWWMGGLVRPAQVRGPNSYGYLGPVNQTSWLGLEAPLAGSSRGQKEPVRERRGLESKVEKELGPAEGWIHSGQRAQCNPPWPKPLSLRPSGRGTPPTILAEP